MSEADKQVDETLARWGVAFAACYCGERKQWENQTVDAFRVTFKPAGKPEYGTDFYQGLGHRKAAPSRIKPKIIAPTAAGVLYCLLSDEDAIDQSFTDWASGLGYDTDSRKALAIYEACCDTGHEMRRLFTHAQRAELRELLQDC